MQHSQFQVKAPFTWSSYRENVRLDTPDTDWPLYFFSYGRDRIIKKLIQGKNGEITISIGDYSYVTGSKSKHRTTYHIVIVMQSPHLMLPNFILIPGIRAAAIYLLRRHGVFFGI